MIASYPTLHSLRELSVLTFKRVIYKERTDHVVLAEDYVDIHTPYRTSSTEQTRPELAPGRVAEYRVNRGLIVSDISASRTIVKQCQQTMLMGPCSLRPTQTLSSIDRLSVTPSNLRRCFQLSMMSFCCLAGEVSHGSPGIDFDCLAVTAMFLRILLLSLLDLWYLMKVLRIDDLLL